MNQAVPNIGNENIVELRIPSSPEWVALARLAVASVASRLHFTVDDIEDVKLAVSEACTNAIQHAQGSTCIEIRCETLPEGLHVRVRDFGRGTRPEQIVAGELGEARSGGLGVFLIRSLMDEANYDVHAERGTELSMFKRRPS